MRASFERGVTLIELVVSIVVIAIAAGAVLGVLSRSAARSADAMMIAQAVSIAEAYLEEVTLKPFADPDGTTGETNRFDFDDVFDYQGLVNDGARDQFGAAIGPLSDYRVSVTVASSAALPSVPSTAAARIDVRVTYPRSAGTPWIDFSLSGYKTP